MSEDIVPEIAAEPDPFGGGSWKGDPPQPDTIAGTVVERDTLTSDKHGETKTVPLLKIRTADGVVVGVPGWRVHIHQLILENDPQVGDGISIRAFGTNPGEKQFLYAMRVRKTGAPLEVDEDPEEDDVVPF